MDAIIGFCTGIADLLGGLVDLVLGFFGDIVYLIRLTAKAVTALPSYLALLPGPATVILMWIFGVVVIYKVLGREG